MTGHSENAEHEGEPLKAAVSTFAVFGFALAILCALAAMLSGPGHRWAWWDFRVGLSILRWTAYGGLGAAGISLVGCILARPGGPRRGFTWAVLGFVTGLAVVGVLAFKEWSYLQIAREVPPIHDITTEYEEPAAFRCDFTPSQGRSEPSRIWWAINRGAAKKGVSGPWACDV